MPSVGGGEPGARACQGLPREGLWGPSPALLCLQTLQGPHPRRAASAWHGGKQWPPQCQLSWAAGPSMAASQVAVSEEGILRSVQGPQWGDPCSCGSVCVGGGRLEGEGCVSGVTSICHGGGRSEKNPKVKGCNSPISSPSPRALCSFGSPPLRPFFQAASGSRPPIVASLGINQVPEICSQPVSFWG